MPCIAKKGEILRGKNVVEGVKDVDASITVREYAKLLKSKGIDLPKLKESEFDKVMGDSSGAGVIFGATGGVMEAALRTVADTLEGKSMDKIDYNAVRGTQGIKEATINVAGKTVNVCVASGLKNAQTVLESIKTGAKKYDFVEIMACPGGCVNGGGMPIHDPNEISFEERAKLRAKSLYTDDERKTIRKSHLNPDIIALYKDYYEKPNSHLAHENLHTVFKKREIK
ncbi:MAG: iron hydrogenase small subunit [Mycoplasmoidaceae bacterium]|nr:iron hydrogenase small subunit [Mycoplasmoidaceae bacterium]